MEFEQKLDIVINEITSVYSLNNSQANLIKQNIINRVKIYQNSNPSFNNDETKIIENSSNIGDFFINRLVTNVRNYDFDQTYNKDNTLKGAYTSQEQSIYIGNHKFIEDISRDKLQARMPNVDAETLGKATLNVFNHEIGHALQTSFKGRYGKDDNKYNQLINNLINKYPNEFKLQASDEALSIRQEGMKATRKDDSNQQARDFYAKNAYATHLDEIFNEDEALQVTGVNKPQLQYEMGNGFSKKIYNYQSSNYKITSYGRMMKIVMGEDLTFKAMYEDSVVAYSFFDQFKDISDKVYQGKPPMFNVLDSLNKIKDSSSLIETQKLELFLAECLQRKVAHDLNSQTLSLEEISKVRAYVSEFSDYMTKNPNVLTKQDAILLNIEKYIVEKEKTTNKKNTDTIIEQDVNNEPVIIDGNNKQNLVSHPRANELNELEKQKQIAKQNNDENSYNNAKLAMEKIIRESRMEVSSKKWDSMSIQDQIAFVQIKLNESRILDDQDEFNYWKASLNNLSSKLGLQSKSVENGHSDDKDLSGLISQLRMKLNQIQNTYRTMLFDGYIDENELATLLGMVSKVINEGKSLKSLVTDSKDLKVISVIISNLEEEQEKINEMQNNNEEIGDPIR